MAGLSVAMCDGTPRAGSDAGEADAGADGDASDEAEACTLVFPIAPVLTVLDQETRQSICDVTLVGPQGAMLVASGDCSYTVRAPGGPSDAAFSVTIAAPGYQETMVAYLALSYGADACVPAEQVTVSLVADPDASAPADAGADARRPADGAPSDASDAG